MENLQNFPEPKKDANGLIGWVDIHDFEEMPLAVPAGVQKPNLPVNVKAGQPIGHPGNYQHHNNVTSQIQLHVECFTPDDLPAFIAKGQAWARNPNVKASDKSLLKVSKGSKLITAVVDTAGKLVVPVVTSPKLTDSGTLIHSDIILPLSALNALPANQKLSLPESTATNAKKLRWWFLNNIGGQADGTKIKGWLCEKNATAISPWEWQGFTTLEDSTEDEKLIAYQLKLGNKLLPAEEGTYSGITDAGKNWPLMKQLIKTITDNKVDGLTLAGTLTTAQLTDAGKGYWCAQKIASIAPKITTEWKKDEARWNKLDALMGHHPDSENPNWVKEKERIKQLSFWDEVSSITGAADGKVWLLNPVELVLNFAAQNDCKAPLSVDSLKKIAAGITSTNADRYVDDVNNLLPSNTINTCLRKGHFLAQIIHESGSFHYTKELGVTLDYDPWRGRGLIQVTFESNYRAYGVLISVQNFPD